MTLTFEELLEGALLAGRQLVVGDEDAEAGLRLRREQLLCLALPHVPVGVDVAPVLPLGAHHLGAGGLGEGGQLGKAVLGVPAGVVAGVDGDEEHLLDGRGEIDRGGSGHGREHSRRDGRRPRADEPAASADDASTSGDRNDDLGPPARRIRLRLRIRPVDLPHRPRDRASLAGDPAHERPVRLAQRLVRPHVPAHGERAAGQLDRLSPPVRRRRGSRQRDTGLVVELGREVGQVAAEGRPGRRAGPSPPRRARPPAGRRRTGPGSRRPASGAGSRGRAGAPRSWSSNVGIVADLLASALVRGVQPRMASRSRGAPAILAPASTRRDGAIEPIGAPSGAAPASQPSAKSTAASIARRRASASVASIARSARSRRNHVRWRRAKATLRRTLTAR